MTALSTQQIHDKLCRIHKVENEQKAETILFQQFGIPEITQIFIDFLPILEQCLLLNLANNENEKDLIRNRMKMYPLSTSRYHEIWIDIQIRGKLKCFDGSFDENEETAKFRRYLKTAEYWEYFDVVEVDIMHKNNEYMNISICISWYDNMLWFEYRWNEISMSEQKMYHLEQYVNDMFDEYQLIEFSEPEHTKYFTEYKLGESEKYRIESERYNKIISLYPYIIVFEPCIGFKIYKYSDNTALIKQCEPVTTFDDDHHYEEDVFIAMLSVISRCFDAKIYDDKLYVLYNNIVMIMDGNMIKTFDIQLKHLKFIFIQNTFDRFNSTV